MTEDTSR